MAQNKNQSGQQGSQGSQEHTEKDENMNRPGVGQGASKENRSGVSDQDDVEAGNTAGQTNPGAGQQK